MIRVLVAALAGLALLVGGLAIKAHLRRVRLTKTYEDALVAEEWHNVSVLKQLMTRLDDKNCAANEELIRCMDDAISEHMALRERTDAASNALSREDLAESRAEVSDRLASQTEALTRDTDAYGRRGKALHDACPTEAKALQERMTRFQALLR